ncbi:polyprenyl synthetase family protein [Bremerella sp. JC817]|uniref:polyprenyl synthetase family protein n=1 Tax=Bremerella sp. JC817 TaxID=3231756 RepID=UPI003458095C
MAEVSTDTFREVAERLRPEIDAALTRLTEFDHDCPEVLREAIRYSLLAPGKRLRPVLALLAAEACGSNASAAIVPACAVEMIHAYSLIHDDLPAMDDDDLRRGRPTCHRQFDEATAILAGDALLTRAFEILAVEIADAEQSRRCLRELTYAAGASQLVGGQVDDLRFETLEGTADDLAAIHRRKTGAMITVSLRLGGIMAHADEAKLNLLTQYGDCLGLAFQITDDLLDVQGDEKSMGKRVGKDADKGKMTFPGVWGIEESRRKAEQLIQQAGNAAAKLPSGGDSLISLAQYVLERNH